MAKKKQTAAQPWADDEAPKPDAADEIQPDESEEDTSLEDQEEVDVDDETPVEPEPEPEAPVSAAIKPAPKKKSEPEALGEDGAKAPGHLGVGDHLPNEVVHLVSQGLTLKQAIAKYNNKKS